MTIQCYAYQVRKLDSDYPNEWHIGYIGAVSDDEAKKILAGMYRKDERITQDILVEDTGETYEEFLERGDELGWD